MTKLQFDFQTASDDDSGILELLEEEVFPGNISLLYTRRDRPLFSLRKEGESVEILLIRETKSGELAAMACCSLNFVFDGGKVLQMGYLFGLRIRKKYRRHIHLLPEGYRFLFDRNRNSPPAFYLTTILEENLSARRVLEKKRKGMPYYDFSGRYEVHALVTGKNYPSSYRLESANSQSMDALIEFYQDYGKEIPYFPVIQKKNLLVGVSFPALENFVVLKDKSGQILAAGAVWDQSAYKQYIIQSYGKLFRILRPISGIFPLFGYPPLPPQGSMLSFFTLSFYAVRDKNPEVFRIFLAEIQNQFRRWAYFTVGIHENDPLKNTLVKFRGLVYKSRIYRVYESPELYEKTKTAGPDTFYLECGRL
ncbi:MAG: hypothetical protein OEZ34_12140 [Spirochaetia bacterium]|nr:hypothetical protein [Spirochaetia bacterium]